MNPSATEGLTSEEEAAGRGKQQANGNGRHNGKAAVMPTMMTSAEFVRDFSPPDYLIDGILQRGFIYSNTGSTGTGKTAIALRLLASVGT